MAKSLNNKTARFANKVAKQNARTEEEFKYSSPVMKSKNSKSYKDHFGNTVAQFERVLRNDKAEIKKRERAISLADQIKAVDIQIESERKAAAIEKSRNTEDARLAERNAMNITKEAVARENAKRGIRFVTDSKGHAVEEKI